MKSGSDHRRQLLVRGSGLRSGRSCSPLRRTRRRTVEVPRRRRRARTAFQVPGTARARTPAVRRPNGQRRAQALHPRPVLDGEAAPGPAGDQAQAQRPAPPPGPGAPPRALCQRARRRRHAPRRCRPGPAHRRSQSRTAHGSRRGALHAGRTPAPVRPPQDDLRYARVAELAALRRALSDASGQERHLLRLRFIEEIIREQIAHELGVSQMQISRLLVRILDSLRHRLFD
ncbi:sigma factor-like helix-turn-helix DNA-binding protein [Sinomonas atrocyanea]|uniref:sigma factor-like helix-turn-helix DNA-binding protein n=1 Tax=Sinomonas atrocyanea TaxID=37927 RepID=UPI0009FDD294